MPCELKAECGRFQRIVFVVKIEGKLYGQLSICVIPRSSELVSENLESRPETEMPTPLDVIPYLPGDIHDIHALSKGTTIIPENVSYGRRLPLLPLSLVPVRTWREIKLHFRCLETHLGSKCLFLEQNTMYVS